ncbi:lipopolysaccharide transport system ATP-binding protein [Oceanihabitans sediminis]|uniref:ATP-binding cassette domain-containing protein n=1 Tax=Oceanihabitans sediminis TaxID=1812012 RepID=A0A368P2K9_9FLAO|nr:ABC transporter ATP-binding protein [Oceanihabitans sediminis]RBP26600.1 lipopolysaccharide transport system ATP-binding protein [Oceanihabitans sediminis]RCU57117.1 ATP-binding cassette domain-containing protein [Oceanihabitans sediminis]
MSEDRSIVADKEVLVKVEGLSKKFCKDLKTSLWYGVKDLISGVRGSAEERELRPKEFWAVKDINFELRRGECLGLIGHNGAGKSTLLKILNGLINPDAGKVTIRGRVGALIELGAGFNPILSGRENIYNNGAILGFSREEIDSKLEDIIAFAELEEFIDMPVQHYSSGMKVRLGFAVAAQMEPDVLIIDEVLAVGDLGFVLKCFKTIDTILPHTAVIFVSHSMPMVSRICSQIILMDQGKAQFQGDDVGKAIDLYYTRFADNESNIVFDDGSIRLNSIDVIGSKRSKDGIEQINWGENLKLRVSFSLQKPMEEVPMFRLILFDKEQRPVAVFKENEIGDINLKDKIIEFGFESKNIQLSKGIYSINISALKFVTEEPFLRINNVISFQVIHDRDVWQPFLLHSKFKTFDS